MCISNITVYDGDKVEEHNLPNQLLHFEQLGIPKVDAIANLVYYQAQVDLNAIPHHYTREPLSGLVICCVDTMDTRLKLWREIKKFKPDLYIDACMSAEVGKVLVV
jgi:molybdopterin/thiamine biosynthesis adenylyltransferase